jgi:Fic family protein
MQTADFTATSPGRLVATVEGAMAFVPAPLPRSLPLEGATLHWLARAERALGELSGVTGRLVNPYLLGSPLLRREAILSSRIEGTYTTAEQLALLEAGAPPADERQKHDTREVLNYIEAMHHGVQTLRELPVSKRLIRAVHAKLLEGVRGGAERPGEFRTSQNYIGKKVDGIKGARFVPPPVVEMLECLDALENYLHLEPHGEPDPAAEPDPTLAPLLVRLALIHYQFETIHPFRDGNGRVGRLLIPLLLISHGRLGEPLLYMSGYLDQQKDAYQDHMLRVSQTGDWRPWLEFFLRGVVASARESVDLAEQLLALRKKWQGQFQSARSSALLVKLIDQLFRSPAITMGQAKKVLHVTHAAASSNIKKLVQAGILSERTGKRWGQVFVASEIVALVEYAHGGAKPEAAPAQAEAAAPEASRTQTDDADAARGP